MTKSKARLAAEEAYMAKLMDDDESEREKYTSFCAHIAATEMEVWVEEVFAGVDLCRNQPVAWPCVDTDADGEITLYDFELLEGREGSSSVRRLFEVVDCIDQDGSITMQEWVQFLANLWHFGGDDLVESTLTNFENLISFRENAEIEAMERALLEAEAAQRSALPTGSMLEAAARRRSGGRRHDHQEEFRLFFDLMGKGVGETGVEACLITFENLLRLRGNKMSEAYELKRKESMQKASGGAAVPALQGVRPQSARRRPSGGLSGRRTPRSSRSGKSLRLHLTPRKDVKPGDKRSSNLPTRDDPTPRELLDSGRLDSSRLNSAAAGPSSPGPRGGGQRARALLRGDGVQARRPAEALEEAARRGADVREVVAVDREPRSSPGGARQPVGFAQPAFWSETSPPAASSAAWTLDRQEAGESRYWGRLKPSFACDFPSPVSAVAFAPGEVRGPDGAPVYRVCVAAGLDVHVLSVGARLGSSWDAPRRKSVGRFKAVAQGACWRGDGRLIAVGDAEGAVHLVDAASGATLRRLAKGHGAGRAAKAACWGHDNSVCSAGADGTLVLWDVTTGAGVRRVENAHADAATGLRGGGGMVASTRSRTTRRSLRALRGAVNAIAVAGGDAAGDARLLNRVLCVGTNAGLLDGRARRLRAPRRPAAGAQAAAGTFRHRPRQGLLAGRPEGSEPLVVVGACVDDGRVAKRARAPKLAAHDARRGFRYKDALDEALKTRDPTVVVAVLEELDRRGGRAIALGDRDEKRLEPVLSRRPRVSAPATVAPRARRRRASTCAAATSAPTSTGAKIHKNATTEVGAMTALLGVSGALDALLATNRLRLDA
ncbi:hypothetical protein JL720_16682 [Aureococcus anophagefferens]|nr:hypothetical protein JL720_16682 [Aureococcus anophagefferens]